MKKMKFILTIILAISFSGFHYTQTKNEINRQFENEVIYHIFLRSFYDSNGDSHGDINGLKEKLDYLQELGVTTVLITPIYNSPFYHNYFPIDFAEIDPEYGNKEIYFNLLKEMHSRGLKLIMDMEIHYVIEEHLWYKDSFENPSSPYSKYIIYNGPGNTKPETIIFNISELQSYDGKIIKIATTDLYNPEVKEYHYDLFKYWVDPNNDGDFTDGVDGFRIDHIMDDLDWKGIRKNLLNEFWKPLFHQLWEINSNLMIIGEQAEWGYGKEYFEKGDMSLLFAFPLRSALMSFNKKNIINKVDSTFLATPKDKSQITFIENHDTPRFASEVDNYPGRLKVGAALNLLLKGVPSIYYGQEIGMLGRNGFGLYGMTDGNDIPVREAFEWYKKIDGKGMTLWYKETGPWWNDRNIKDNDGISLEEEKKDPNSLWNYYKNLIKIRKENSALSLGEFRFIPNENDSVISFLRWNDVQSILVIINLSESNQSPEFHLNDVESVSWKSSDLLNENETIELFSVGRIQLDAYEVKVLLYE